MRLTTISGFVSLPLTRPISAERCGSTPKVAIRERGAIDPLPSMCKLDFMSTERFTVDTQLFRELGDLLVGRDSTALAELVKNAYDADARSVTILGTRLSDKTAGAISIVDDGVGMTEAQFRKGFLTIAGRSKRSGERSPIFGRALTGEKGLGRLAARKLARRMVVDTRAHDGSANRGGKLIGEPRSLTATIDWDIIDKCATLDQIEAAGAVVIQRHRDTSRAPPAGTTITLNSLRREWTERQKSNFVTEITSMQPWPAVVSRLPAAFGKLLFAELEFPSMATRDAPFYLKLEGDFGHIDPLKGADPNAATWVVEIDCDVSSGRIDYALAPSKSYWAKEGIDAQKEKFSMPIAQTENDAFAMSFRARIFEREGNPAWDPAVAGVRVFMDGFRVLPYGSARDDWLLIDHDYTTRSQSLLPRLKALAERISDVPLPEGVTGEYLSMKRTNSYMGAVFLSKINAPNLEMLVNREGFLANEAFEWLRDRVRMGVDLIIRARYAATSPMRRARRDMASEIRDTLDKDIEKTPSVILLQERAREAREAIGRAREALARSDQPAAERELKGFGTAIESFSKAADEMGTEQAMFRVLASVGAQLWALSHEINGLLELCSTIRRRLERFSTEIELSRSEQRTIADISARLGDLHHGLERQATYLTDVAGLEARRRRSRQPFRERFEAAQRLLQFAIDRREITVDNDLPSDLRSPSMFPAEIVAIFTNLLSNAIKAAGHAGGIKVRAGRSSEPTIVVENTGVAVDVDDSEKWFKPFRSTTVATDAALGQGMGLGLTIVRSILDEYGATASFIRPSKNYSTAIELRFPAP